MLAIGIMYFGIANRILPLVLLFTYITWGFLYFLWILKPLITDVHVIPVLKNAKYFQFNSLFKLFVATTANIISMVGIKIASIYPPIILIFLITKILVFMIVELSLFLIIYADDLPFPLE